jgi:hypothetical protein
VHRQLLVYKLPRGLASWVPNLIKPDLRGVFKFYLKGNQVFILSGETAGSMFRTESREQVFFQFCMEPLIDP